MASATWWDEIDSYLYTYLTVKLKSALLSEFPKLYVTNSPKTDAAAMFPTVYIHTLESTEMGDDLNNTEIHAMLKSFQIDVLSNSSLADSKKVMREVVTLMKAKRFSIIGFPIYSAENNVYTGICRFQRMIGASDSEIVPE